MVRYLSKIVNSGDAADELINNFGDYIAEIVFAAVIEDVEHIKYVFEDLRMESKTFGDQLEQWKTFLRRVSPEVAPAVDLDMVVSPLVHLPTAPTSATVRLPTAPPVTADMVVSPLVRPPTALISVAVRPPTALTSAAVRPPIAPPIIADMVVSPLVRSPTAPISVTVRPPTTPISTAELAAAADGESGWELPEFVPYTEDLPPAVDHPLPQMVHSLPPHLTDAAVDNFHVSANGVEDIWRATEAVENVSPEVAPALDHDMVVSALVRLPTAPTSAAVRPPTAPPVTADVVVSPLELPEFVPYTEDLPPAVDPPLPQMMHSPPPHLTDAAVDNFHVSANGVEDIWRATEAVENVSPEVAPALDHDMVVSALVRLPTAPTSAAVRPPTAPPVTADVVVSPLVRPPTAHISVAVRPPTAPISAAELAAVADDESG
ncbi:hypothetical protein MLD38_002385 [Melastoma candidum]|uniref:Uncharacterized protein n=1 Tax=Melastoma candidum TaxID=119954 RepID=A0ACB9RZR8_9MYRT|nr:hypothetical protein MLD38_002385 [Melastoma candidum]